MKLRATIRVVWTLHYHYQIVTIFLNMSGLILGKQYLLYKGVDIEYSESQLVSKLSHTGSVESCEWIDSGQLI